MNEEVGLTRRQMRCSFILDFPVTRTVRNKCPLLMSHLDHDILLEQPKQTKEVTWGHSSGSTGKSLFLWVVSGREAQCRWSE